jgi:hypothetical protein
VHEDFSSRPVPRKKQMRDPIHKIQEKKKKKKSWRCGLSSRAPARVRLKEKGRKEGRKKEKDSVL